MAAEIWRWITPTGTAYRLDSNVDGAQIVESVSGRYMPPIRRTSELVPLQAGSRLRSVLHDESEVALGVYFNGADATALRTNLRQWAARLNPANGPGILQVTGPDGSIRQLACSYHDGLELTEDAGSRVDQVAILTFVASDPYWANPTASTQTFTAGTPSTFFPIFPLRLSASQVTAATSLTNVGDVDSYPVWSVTGPGSILVLTNHTTGRILVWFGTLGGGEVLTIDTRPGNQSGTPKSVFKSDGSDQFGLLTAWDFWPLVPGVNDIEIELTGTSGSSSVGVSWQSRYLSV